MNLYFLKEYLKAKKHLKQFRYFLTNKYLVTAAAFAIWIMFFDRNDLPLQFKRYQQLNQLEKNEQSLKQQTTNTKRELELLKTNPETLERYAREKYMMKKDNEDLFIVTIDSSLIK